MNLGRFHVALHFIVLEIKDDKIIELLKILEESLQQSISQPNAESSKFFREQLEQLRRALLSAGSNTAPPTDKLIYDEIGATGRVGVGLWENVNEVISMNNLTPASALIQVTKIHKDIVKYYDVINSIDDSFSYLDIEYDSLAHGEFEIGFSIPRSITTDKLESLKEELSDIDYCMRSFNEVATGDGSSSNISTISASSWQIFLESAPKAAVCMAVALERIVRLYKTNQEIKLIKKQLEDKKIPDGLTGQLQQFIDDAVKSELRKIGDDLVDEYYKGDEGRKNELKNKMPKAMRYLADRIDRGAIVEVRAEPPELPKEEKGADGTMANPSEDDMLKYKEVQQLVEFVDKKMEEVAQLEVRDGPTLAVNYDRNSE